MKIVFQMKEPFFRSRFFIVLVHALVWIAFITVPLIALLHRPDPGERPHMIIRIEDGPPMNAPHPGPVKLSEMTLDSTVIWRIVLSNLFWILIFYFNAYFLVPRYFKRERILVYLSYVLLLLALFFLFSFLTESRSIIPTLLMSFRFFFIMAISLSFRIVADYLRNEKKQKEKETLTLRSELAFLRSQINPHFIFNVLNILVSLARKKSDKLEPTLIRLSGLLHYMLYEPDNDKVNLQREIDYLKDYIALQSIRFGDQLKIESQFETDKHAESCLLEPMLLIPFVENAFKHGTDVLENPFIRISLLQKEKEIRFTVENKFSPSRKDHPENQSGIGHSNVKRRLDLLYKGQYSLTVEKKNDFYIVQLLISLA